MSSPLDDLLVQKVKLREPEPPPLKQAIAEAPVIDVPDLGTLKVKIAAAEPVEATEAGTPIELVEEVPEESAAIVTVDAEAPKLTLHDEIAVYQGSLYLWVILWMIAIMGATQLFKRAFEWPLRKKKPPFKLFGVELGGMSRDGWEWLVKIQPAIWCWPTTLYFGPTALRAMGYEFTAVQSLMFAPGAAGMALGVWAVLPKRFKRWLNGYSADSATEADVRKLRELLDDVQDSGIREQLSTLTDEHSVVEEDDDPFEAKTPVIGSRRDHE